MTALEIAYLNLTTDIDIEGNGDLPIGVRLPSLVSDQMAALLQRHVWRVEHDIRYMAHDQAGVDELSTYR